MKLGVSFRSKWECFVCRTSARTLGPCRHCLWEKPKKRPSPSPVARKKDRKRFLSPARFGEQNRRGGFSWPGQLGSGSAPGWRTPSSRRRQRLHKHPRSQRPSAEVPPPFTGGPSRAPLWSDPPQLPESSQTWRFEEEEEEESKRSREA